MPIIGARHRHLDGREGSSESLERLSLERLGLERLGLERLGLESADVVCVRVLRGELAAYHVWYDSAVLRRRLPSSCSPSPSINAESE